MKMLEQFLGSTIRHALVFASAEDYSEFYNGYPSDEQANVREWHDSMMQIEEAKNAHRGSKMVAAKHPGRAGWSAKNLEAIHKMWVEADRDWRVLVDKKRFPDAREPELPAEMQSFIRAMFSSNQRKNRPAWRKIIRKWEAWLTTGDPRHRLPGYDVCPPPGANGRHPRSLGYANCNRYAPPRAESVIARIGVHAGMAILPKIPGTREGVRFMEYVSGDDVWLKRKCFVPGFGPLRVLQFGMMDYGASYYLDRFIQRPAVPRLDGTEQRLKRRDFLWCVAMMLERYGFPVDYVMHIILERGTATMSAAEARYLFEASHGQIVVCYSTMEGELVHAWEESKSGNSNAKGWHESFHNLFANEEADLPGQVGKDRDHAPAALLGRERHAMALNNAAMILTPDQRARLMLPFPDPSECYGQSLERVGWINHRKEHGCQGFSTVFDWRPHGMDILPLPEAALPKWLEANPHATAENLEKYVQLIPRPETPHERMLKLSHGARFMQLPQGVWRRFYEDLHISEKVDDDGRIGFTCKETKRKLWFEPADARQDGLKPGTEVTGFYRPDGSAIHLFSGGADMANQRYLLTWQAVTPSRRGDTEGKQRDFARKRAALNVALANVREATTEEVARAQAAYRNNDAVLVENGLIPATEETLAVVQDGCTPLAAQLAAVDGVRTAETQRKQKKQRTAADLTSLADAALSRVGDQPKPQLDPENV